MPGLCDDADLTRKISFPIVAKEDFEKECQKESWSAPVVFNRITRPFCVMYFECYKVAGGVFIYVTAGPSN